MSRGIVHFRTGIANSAAKRASRVRQAPSGAEVILRCRTGQPADPSIGSAVSPDFTTPPRPGVFEPLSLEMELTSVIPSVPLCFRRGLLALVMASAATAASAPVSYTHLTLPTNSRV